VQPLHVAAWIEMQTKEHAAPTAKARLAAVRHLFDWLVTGQVVPMNPASSVRGPSQTMTAGKTPVLSPEEARTLIDSIEVTTVVGLRDRAPIALMVFSFARIRAALGMKAEDVFTQNRRLWVRLREKGGKAHAMPCHHNLETYLTAYIEGAGLDATPKGPLFRTIGRGKGRRLTRTSLPQANAYQMIRRRGCSRHRHQARQSQLPGHRHHGVSEERRHAGEGGADGEPCLDAHDAALRPPARGTQPR
jgi:site-specific recombinase XerC